MMTRSSALVVVVFVALWPASSALASPASRDECQKAMARIKAWEGDTSPLSDDDMKQCQAQATAEQARCIIAAATKDAGRTCLGEPARSGAADATATPPSAVDPVDQKAAPCKLTATAAKPLPAALLHALRASSDDVRPHQSLVVKGDDGARVFDPIDLRRVVNVPDDLREAMLLPARLVGVRDREELVVAPAAGVPLTSVRKGHRLRTIDALAVGSDTFVAGVEDNARVFVDRVGAGGKLVSHHVLPRVSVMVVRLARSSDGKVALAWLEASRDRGTALWLAWCDRDGAIDRPVHVDDAAEEQLWANLALAAHKSGVVVAWNPIVGAAVNEVVPVEIRVFHADGGAPPTLVRRVQASSMSWVVAGSAGGVVPNNLQALAFGRNAALVWTAMTKETAELRGVAVDGGAPALLVPRMRAQPIARSDGKAATVLLEEPNAGHQSLTLRCE